jgi:hypothetical protein
VIVTGTAQVTGALTALTLASTSARRFKKKIRRMTGALDTVKQLRGVNFQWKNLRHGGNDFGLIAEEVAAVLPQAVAFGTEGEIVGVQYAKLTALLIEAVKTLSDEVDQLKRDALRN